MHVWQSMFRMVVVRVEPELMHYVRHLQAVLGQELRVFALSRYVGCAGGLRRSLLSCDSHDSAELR